MSYFHVFSSFFNLYFEPFYFMLIRLPNIAILQYHIKLLIKLILHIESICIILFPKGESFNNALTVMIIKLKWI
jgi:hypothetical protein